MNRFQVLLSSVAVLASSFAMADPVNINFEGTSAPCLFSSTSALTNRYAASGVVFSSSASTAWGGAILNKCGNFGFAARSGTDFLAYSQASWEITLTFSALVDSVSIWSANGAGSQVLMQAYGPTDQLLGGSSSTGGTTWKQLAFNGAGISSVKLKGTGSGGLDDLSFNVAAASAASDVPEPAALALVGLGLLGVAASRRRKG
jgi:PEP-CTERM motif